MPVARRLTLAVSAAVVLALLTPVASAAWGDPTPSVAGVTQKLTELARQSETLTEQYNAATEDVAAKQRAADQAKHQADQAVADYQSARSQLSSTIAAVYEGSEFRTASALLTSTSGQDYVDTLNTLDVIGAHRSDLVSMLDAKKQTADSQITKATALLSDAKKKQADLAKQRSAVESSISSYQSTLDRLNAEQRAAYLNQNAATPQVVHQAQAQAQTPGSSPVSSGSYHASSAAAQAAVNFALAQVGKPYVYAASGPNSYDCSGLTMASWRQGGISLPHNAAEQYGYGTHISVSQLQPGDLMFYYQPIGHVTIYVGNGMMVSAPQPGENVKLMPISSMMGDYTGATHL